MRVALVCPYDLDKPGGVQDQVARLRAWLLAAGHDAVIIGPGEGSDGDGVIHVGGSVTVPANRSATPVALNPRVAGRVRDAVAPADVVHIHEPLMPVVSYAATRFRDKPSVGTFHADAPGWARRTLGIGPTVVRRITSRLDVVTAVSEVARSVVPAIESVRIIPNGIDVAEYEVGDKADGSVVFLGRDDPRKGLDVLLEAWERVSASRPHAHLRILGADRSEPQPGVEFLGRVDGAEKRRYLASSSIGVAPNLGGESFGIVLAEMMASGCALVASAIPAFVRVVGEAGVLVQPGDAAGLADAIVALLDDGERRSELAEAARERAWQYDGASVASQYLTAYEDAIVQHR